MVILMELITGMYMNIKTGYKCPNNLTTNLFNLCKVRQNAEKHVVPAFLKPLLIYTYLHGTSGFNTTLNISNK